MDFEKLRDAHVTHKPSNRVAVVTHGPMVDARGQHQVCRVRFVDDGSESWEFAEDLEAREPRAVKQESR